MSVIDTTRLTIREMSADDAEFMLTLMNDASFISNIGDRGIKTLEAARAYIADGPVASYGRYGYGMYIVASRESGIPMGICGLVKRDTLDDPDIGFAFLPAYWSRGYAAESALAVRDYARDVLKVKRLLAIARPDNSRSVRLIEKIGLRAEKSLKLGGEGPELTLFACEF